MTNKKDLIAFTLIGIVFSLPFYLMPMNNPDIFWHLSAGKFIVSNFSIPHSDFLSWTMDGKPWLDFEWLTQVVYYILNNSFGIESLYFLKILLVSQYLCILSLIINLHGAKPIHSIWLLPLSAAAVLSSNDIRPENFSVFFFVLSWYLLEKAKKNSYTGKYPFYFFLLFSIWVNFHGGFVYGQILIFLFLCGEMLNENIAFLAGKEKISFKLSQKLLFILIAATIGTFLNPYGYKIYSVISQHFIHSSSYQSYISEWQDFDITFDYARPFSFLLISFPILYLINFIRKREINFIEVFMAFFFVISALIHVRVTIFAGIILTGLSASFLKDFKGKKSTIALPIIFISALCLHFLITVSRDYFNFKISKFYFSSPSLSSFLKENEKELSHLRMYNSWAWGGYLGWELYPSYKVFMDGRYIFSDLLPQFMSARTSIPIWKNFSSLYDFQLVIMPYSSKLIPVRKKVNTKDEYAVLTTFYSFQLPHSKWALVYFDQKNLIAVRRDSVSKEWLKRNEYSFIGPHKQQGLEYPIYIGQISLKPVKEEILRYALKMGTLDENSQAIELLEWLKKAEKYAKDER